LLAPWCLDRSEFLGVVLWPTSNRASPFLPLPLWKGLWTTGRGRYSSESMASCDPLRETQQFEAMREALRRAISQGENPASSRHGEKRTIRPLPLKRRTKS
jgi:hypothetical protein